MFTRFLPLDIASRIMDMYFRDGEEFIFRTALGIIKYYEDELLKMDSFTVGIQLTSKNSTLSQDDLFEQISTISTPSKWYQNLVESLKI
ncbi:hypothetical protein HZS_5966 [Henneguya salminicola]|nr:hypothetical protein HZS_5966 [Henneguya salminicola]